MRVFSRLLSGLCVPCGKTRLNTQLDNPMPKIDNVLDKFLIDGSDIGWSDTVEFVPPVTGGRVIKVYDGDTITLAAKLPYAESPLYRFRVRLNGIDTPEIKGSSEDEKTAAKMAKEYVEKLALNKYVRLENVSTEKYGRILADVYVGELNINQNLLKERYAVPYGGGTKCAPASWLQYKEG